MLNSGVIADTGQFPVYLAGSKKGRVELAEGMRPPRAAKPVGWWRWNRIAQRQRQRHEKNAGPGIRHGRAR